MVLGNHEAMMMTDDMRYVHPGEYAAFADRDSKARRDRIYEANKAAVEAAYRAKTPDMSPEAIKDEWMKTMPLGKIEYMLAWRPEGELGKWALANPAVVKLGDSLFVHGGISSAYASQSIEDINRQVEAALKARGRFAERDHQSSAWAALVPRLDGPRRRRRGHCCADSARCDRAAHHRAGNRPRATELSA